MTGVYLKVSLNIQDLKKKDYEKLSIIFDKLDKIGIEGIRKELADGDFNTEASEKFISIFESGGLSLDSVKDICSEEFVQNIQTIMDTVTTVTNGTVVTEFAPSLVRGQGYYTGTIFEVEAEGYSGAVAGGGRYDNLIGKFLNEDIQL